MSGSTVPIPYPSHYPCPNHLLQHWSPHYWWSYQDDSWELCVFYRFPTGVYMVAQPDAMVQVLLEGKTMQNRTRTSDIGLKDMVCTHDTVYVFSILSTIIRFLYDYMLSILSSIYQPKWQLFLYILSKREAATGDWLHARKSLSKAFYALMTNDVSTTMSSYVIMKQSLTMQPVLTPVHSVLIKSAARCLDLSPC